MGRGKRAATARATPRGRAAILTAATAVEGRPDGPVFHGQVEAEVLAAVARVRAELAASPDLLKPDWRRRNAEGHPMTGHCYVASEAVHRLIGGDESGWHSWVMNFEDDVNWQPGKLTHRWLQHEDGRLIDPTADQFATPVPYERGKRAAFMTNSHLAGRPSTRTQLLLERLGA